MQIEAQSTIPKYLQFKQILRDAVVSGELADRLPPERELAETYSISYMTVRRAVGELVEEDILYRETGRGTFVCPPGMPARKTFNLAFVLPRPIRHGVANAYYSRVFSGVQSQAAEMGYRVLVSNDPQDVFALDRMETSRTSGRKADGMIAVIAANHDDVREIARFMPVVLVDGYLPGSGLPSVGLENELGGHLATQHLIELGHTRIAHITGRRASAPGTERMAGYTRALAEAGLEPEDSLIAKGDFEFESGCAAARELLDLSSPPTAIFAANDMMALGALSECQRAGLRVPEDISLVGFDDIRPASLVFPALTTVLVPKEEMGQRAVARLLQLVNREGKGAEQELLMPALVERESTAPPKAS